MTALTRAELYRQNPLGVSTHIEDVQDTLSFFDDWEERYGYIIELGKQLPGLPAADKIEENFIHGCQSQVWVVHEFDAQSGKIHLLVESDALIVKGLAAIVMCAFNNKSPQEILDYDIEGLFAQLDLIRHLSPTRGNGLRSMVRKIRALAEKHL